MLFRHSLFLFNAPTLCQANPIPKIRVCTPDPSGSFFILR
nr:MAG TPA: hypothetical protein [Caudoviricetes sp.]